MTRATDHTTKALGIAFLALCALGLPERAAAFCGFYVTGADTSLYANATMTVLMRDGTRTVLSMQNNYQGPADAFALVIPVPMVLQKEQVKILPKDVFAKVDALGAPRLVEYWEADPCRPIYPVTNAQPSSAPTPPQTAGGAMNAPVRIEAQFVVGEYEVVILSADNSSALDGWLRDNKYNIPQGAEPVLAPYVAAGMKFFVAKVDPTKVTFENGQAALSPLRFYYDTPEFSLPVRLGLLNSQGSQDLIVNILARNRYELANYPNATVPTNIRVQNEVRNDCGSLYEALYSRVLEKQPGAVVTEYSWSAGSCDPCPTPPLGQQEIMTLGGDVLQGTATGAAGSGGQQFVPPQPSFGFTLTRLHARYTKDSLGEDLVFKQADPILGGRGMPDTKGMLDQTVQKQPGGVDNFQGRYVILHPWEKELTCQNPSRGQWGGPSGMGTPPSSMGATNNALKGAPPKAGDLSNLLAESVPSLAVDAKRPVAPLGSVAGSSAKPAAAGSGGAAGKPGNTSVAGTAATLPRAGTPATSGSSSPTTPPAATGGTTAPLPNGAPKHSSSCSTSGVRSGNHAGWLGVLAGLAMLGGRRAQAGAALMRRGAALLPLVAAGMLACHKAEPAPAQQPKPQPQLLAATAPQVLHAKLPRDDGPFFPSQLRVEGDKPIDPALLADVQACSGCHEEAAREWASSAHAHASFDNPWYRASVDALRDEVGFEASRHCGGCHDPVLTVAGAMDQEVKPEDPRVAVGVTCLVCHSVRAATSDGNASYVLTSAPVPYPEPGDAESLQRHRDRLAAKPLRTPALCASCHRGFLGRHTGISHHLSGMDEPGAWRGSAWAGTRSNTPEPVTAKTCAECHMRPEPVRFEEAAAKGGTIRSHRFPGAHTPFAAFSGDARQTQVLEEQLRGGIVLDAPVIWHNGEAKLSSELATVAAGDRLALDVTVRNLAVGHSFPGGVKDMQDTWIELQVRDARGRELARAGTRHARGDDPTAFVMRALQVDAEGRPETRHVVTRFGTVAYDHTVPPLGARTVRYSWTVPEGSAGPLRVQARVLHRRHRKEAREFACEATRSKRSRAFVSAAPRRLDEFFDGCREEPITEVASIDLELGKPDQRRPSWERLYDHALGLSLSLQEDLAEAHASAERALKELEGLNDKSIAPEQRAKLLTLLGRISARQGRLEEALAYADRAQALLGEHPAVARVRADAYAQVWRWKEAAAVLTECTRLAPGDTAAFRDLAKARFSAGDPPGALQAAHSGLALQPRDEGLLRVQALALEATGSPDAAAARKAFLYYREADETTAARLACDRVVPNCLRDRDPVVKIDLDPARMLVRTAR